MRETPSWRRYQVTLKRRRQWGTLQGPLKLLLLTTGLGYAVFSGAKHLLPPKVVSASKRSQPKPTALDYQSLLLRAQHGDTQGLTISRPLQKQMDTLLKRYRVDWGAAALMDPKTGAVLALSAHSEKDPQFVHRAFEAIYPAASLFKVVTGTAAIDQKHLMPESLIRFTGDVRYVVMRELLRPSGASAMSLETAFARSANKVFGRVAAHQLGPDTLGRYAQRFGFNESIESDLPVPTGLYHLASKDALDVARTGAGFGDVTISPLHAAAMAAAIANDGIMMTPFVNQDSDPRMWRKVMEPAVAREVKQLMRATIAEGTARRPFRQAAHRHRFDDVGGKTGSLTGTIIPAKHEWFMGYVEKDGRQLALGIVLIHERIWRAKPSALAKVVFERYVSQLTDVAQATLDVPGV